MSTWIALGVALTVVILFIIALVGSNLLIGTYEFFFGKPKLHFLKTNLGGNGFAFAFKWNQAKEPAKFDTFVLRLFNHDDNHSQFEVTKKIKASNGLFVQDLDLGSNYTNLISNDTQVQMEIASTTDGVTFYYNMLGRKFKKHLAKALTTIDSFAPKSEKSGKKMKFGKKLNSIKGEIDPEAATPEKELKIKSNPQFIDAFKADDGGSADEIKSWVASKVWIEPGCIVCNACEDIIPEVFEIKDGTCLVRSKAPLDNGLKIEEAAEACPVEVIKFTK